jgi:SM-20-related protein
MSLLDYQALKNATTAQEPFPWFVVPNIVSAPALAKIEEDFPIIPQAGSFPLPSLRYGKNFASLMQELQSPALAVAIGEKLGMDLSKRPTMITVRGQCRRSDGKIHTDSTTKLVTVLLYMNGRWEQAGGRLRLLRSDRSLEDAFAEVPPEEGTMLVFKNQPNAWHGHDAFEGRRRVIQLNWVTNAGVVWREQFRHRLSALSKRWRRSA